MAIDQLPTDQLPIEQLVIYWSSVQRQNLKLSFPSPSKDSLLLQWGAKRKYSFSTRGITMEYMEKLPGDVEKAGTKWVGLHTDASYPGTEWSDSMKKAKARPLLHVFPCGSPVWENHT